MRVPQGKNRFETSIAIAERFFYKPETVVLAYAWNFPDGLCGGPLAVSMNAPLILTMDKYEVRAAEYVQSQPVRKATILGGEGLISQNAVQKIFSVKE
jgi:putative cell wall-binding protein